VLSSQAWLSNVITENEAAGSRPPGFKSLALGDTERKWLHSHSGGWRAQGATRCFKEQY